MDQSQTLETAGVRASPVEFGDGDTASIAGYDICDASGAVDEHPDLDAGLAGDTAYFRAQFMGEGGIGRDLPPVQPLEGPDLRCLQSPRVAEYGLDMNPLCLL